MKGLRGILILVCAGLSSCMWSARGKKAPADINIDTLKFHYQAIHERATDCAVKRDSACSTTNIKFPVFNNAIVLNDTVKKRLLALFDQYLEHPSKQNDTSFAQLSKSFLASYEKRQKEQPSRHMFYTLDSYAKVMRQDSSLTTLEFGGYEFNGSAHGATVVQYINWNTKTNKNLKLTDLLIDGYEKPLNQIAEKIFRKHEELSDSASLKPDYFFKDGKFALNQNFLITPLGLRFMYNIYEIKPYAAGRTPLLIPYAQIKNLLKPNTVISQYHL